jgi:hypothetical protein
MAVTDLRLPYIAISRQPASSLFHQGEVRPGVNSRGSAQRCRLGIPSKNSGEQERGRRCDPNYQLAHLDPPFVLEEAEAS